MSGAPSISYSKLLLFKKCPRMYWHRYLERAEEKETTWPGGLFGTACHAGLERVVAAMASGGSCRDAEGAVVGAFPTLFEEARAEARETFRESREFKADRAAFMSSGDRALRSVARFFSAYFSRDAIGWTSIDSEREYRAEWSPGVGIVGIIDVRMALPQGLSYVVDLKVTGDGSTYWWMDWERDMQSLMYDLLLRRQAGAPAAGFAYMVYDRTLSTLFVKERPQCDPEPEGRESTIGGRILELDAFNRRADDALALEMARPSEQGCKWCPWAKRCGRRWQSQSVRAVRAAMARGSAKKTQEGRDGKR